MVVKLDEKACSLDADELVLSVCHLMLTKKDMCMGATRNYRIR